MREHPPPVPWIVAGLVMRGGLTILTGDPGRGKSLLSQILAAGVGAGHTEAGMECEPGRALILDAENGEAEIHRRVHALQPPSGRLTIVETEGFDLRFDLDGLDRLIEEHRPDLVVLDSFRTLWAGKENDPGEVVAALAPLQAMLRRHDAGGLLLHHVGKAQESMYRGSSAIAATCELIFRLGRAEGDGDEERRYLRCIKSRPAPEPPLRWLRLSVEAGRILLSEAEAPEGADRNGPGRPSTAGRFVPIILAKLDEGPQTQADLARAIDQHPSSGTVRKLTAMLATEGAIVRDGEHGPWRRAELPDSQGAGNFSKGELPPARRADPPQSGVATPDGSGMGGGDG